MRPNSPDHSISQVTQPVEELEIVAQEVTSQICVLTDLKFAEQDRKAMSVMEEMGKLLGMLG